MSVSRVREIYAKLFDWLYSLYTAAIASGKKINIYSAGRVYYLNTNEVG